MTHVIEETAKYVKLAYLRRIPSIRATTSIRFSRKTRTERNGYVAGVKALIAERWKQYRHLKFELHRHRKTGQNQQCEMMQFAEWSYQLTTIAKWLTVERIASHIQTILCRIICVLPCFAGMHVISEKICLKHFSTFDLINAEGLWCLSAKLWGVFAFTSRQNHGLSTYSQAAVDWADNRRAKNSRSWIVLCVFPAKRTSQHHYISVKSAHHHLQFCMVHARRVLGDTKPAVYWPDEDVKLYSLVGLNLINVKG